MTEKCPFQFDLMNPMTHNKGLPFEAFATLRQECPVSFQDGAALHGGDFWAITKREDLDFVSKTPTSFRPVPIWPIRNPAGTTLNRWRLCDS
jgi:hypothetical protein